MCGIFEVTCWFDVVVMGVIGLFASIPVPDFLANDLTIPAGVSFFADAAQLPEGIAIVFGAYTARFLLRRIPVIG
jgi:hypothetical protein